MILLASTFVICLLITLFAIFYLVPQPFFDFALRAQYRSAGLEKKTVTVDGHEITYLTGGQGPPLVLLHGFGADKYHWPMVAKVLGEHFTIYAPDLPGFGESTQVTSARYTGPDQVSRIREFTETLGLKNINIGGNSMGGYLAGLYVSRYSEDVASLWLLAPAGVLSADPSELVTLLEQGDNPLLVDGPDSYDRLVDMCFTKPPYVPGPFKRCICVESMENRNFHAKLFEELMSDPHSLEEHLAGSTIPTLISWGDEDRILDVTGARRLAEVMANAKVEIMGNMGHIPMLERPAETGRQFLAFQQIS